MFLFQNIVPSSPKLQYLSHININQKPEERCHNEVSDLEQNKRIYYSANITPLFTFNSISICIVKKIIVNRYLSFNSKSTHYHEHIEKRPPIMIHCLEQVIKQ